MPKIPPLLLDIDKMPLVLPEAGKNEQSVGVFSEKLGDHRALLTEKQSVLRQTAVYDVEVTVLAATREKYGVFSEGVGCCLVPSPPRERLIHTVIVELGPE